MYVTEPPTTVTALDVRTGKPIWRWTAPLPPNLLTIGLFPTNRGVAILGDTVYVATIDAHLVALDAKTGAVKWTSEIGKNADAVAITQAPLAIDGKIIVGMGGGEGGLRGYIDAYDTKDGHRLWRLYTIPTTSNPALKPGKATATNTAAPPPGIPEPTILRRTLSSGAPAIRLPIGMATRARATTSIPARCSRSMRIPAR